MKFVGFYRWNEEHVTVPKSEISNRQYVSVSCKYLLVDWNFSKPCGGAKDIDIAGIPSDTKGWVSFCYH